MQKFFEAVKNIAERFDAIDKKEIIRVISHLDTDGICSASILIDLLNRQKRKYNISILPQLKEQNIKEFASEPTNVFVFTDLGSGQIDFISRILKDKTVFVLDHHLPKSEVSQKNIYELNPCNYGIDGSMDISGSGVVYFFAKELTQKTSMSHIALIGAIGDTQEKNGFSGLNRQILKDAVESKKILVTKGLKFFGLQTKPVHKLLQYSTDLVIPGVTGSEYDSLQFLKSLDIKPKIGPRWKRLNQLSADEKKRLVKGIIEKRAELENPEDVFCNVYLLPTEQENSPFRDAKEFSTLLNACGRLHKSSIGIGACLNSHFMKKRAMNALTEYKRTIVFALNWFEDNKNNKEFVTAKKNYTILNAQENIPATMIGTISSIITKGNGFGRGHYLLALAQNNDLTTKVSLRMTGHDESADLNRLIGQILLKTGHGEGGGHLHAAGAIIDTEKEDEFLDAAREVLDSLVVEEKID